MKRSSRERPRENPVRGALLGGEVTTPHGPVALMARIKTRSIEACVKPVNWLRKSRVFEGQIVDRAERSQ